MDVEGYVGDGRRTKGYATCSIERLGARLLLGTVYGRKRQKKILWFRISGDVNRSTIP